MKMEGVGYEEPFTSDPAWFGVWSWFELNWTTIRRTDGCDTMYGQVLGTFQMYKLVPLGLFTYEPDTKSLQVRRIWNLCRTTDRVRE